MSDPVLIAITVAAAPVILAVATLVKVARLHTIVNSRLDQLLAQSKELAKAEAQKDAETAALMKIAEIAKQTAVALRIEALPGGNLTVDKTPLNP